MSVSNTCTVLQLINYLVYLLEYRKFDSISAVCALVPRVSIRPPPRIHLWYWTDLHQVFSIAITRTYMWMINMIFVISDHLGHT